MHYPHQIPCDRAPSEEVLNYHGENILELLDLWDEKLSFLKSENPVLAVEYASWHALVRIYLDPSIKLGGTHGTTRQVDFELAQSCFREIEKAHRTLNGSFLFKVH
jgi:hypothetical protein